MRKIFRPIKLPVVFNRYLFVKLCYGKSQYIHNEYQSVFLTVDGKKKLLFRRLTVNPIETLNTRFLDCPFLVSREEKGRKVRVPKALQTRGSGSMLPQKINFRVSEMPFPAFSAEHFSKWIRRKMQ